MKDASYFHTPSDDGPGVFTIQWNGGSSILDRRGAHAARLLKSVEGKSSDEIREILQQEIVGSEP